MVGWIILTVWLFGWVFSIYPIYATLTRTHQENLFSDRSHYPLKRKDIGQGIAGATGLGLLWFIALPAYLSFMFHKKGKPKLTEEKERQIEDYKNESDRIAAVKEAMNKAKRELAEESSRGAKDETEYGRIGNDDWRRRR